MLLCPKEAFSCYPNIVSGSSGRKEVVRRQAPTTPLLMHERLVARAVRARPLFAQPFDLVVLVFAVISFEEHPLRLVLGSEDMRCDAIEKPAVVRDHHDAARELEKCLLERPQRLDIEVVRRLVQGPARW